MNTVIITGGTSDIGHETIKLFNEDYDIIFTFNKNKEKSKEIEKKFDKKIVTLVWKFDIFYPAENYHQDYYEKNFIRYLMYKNACKREETLKRIWN